MASECLACGSVWCCSMQLSWLTWSECVPLKFMDSVLNLKGDRIYGLWEGSALMNAVNTYKRGSTEIPHPSNHGPTQKEGAIYEHIYL